MQIKLMNCDCELTVTKDGQIHHVRTCTSHTHGFDYKTRNEIRTIITTVREEYKKNWPRNVAVATTEPFQGDDEIWRLHLCPVGQVWSILKEIKKDDAWVDGGWWSPHDAVAEWDSSDRALEVATTDYQKIGIKLKWSQN